MPLIWKLPWANIMLTMALKDSEDDRFIGCAAPLFSANTAGAKIGFIDFNLAG